eukprot:7183311-Prymnesium_polylepis.2
MDLPVILPTLDGLFRERGLNREIVLYTDADVRAALHLSTITMCQPRPAAQPTYCMLVLASFGQHLICLHASRSFAGDVCGRPSPPTADAHAFRGGN